MSKEKTHQNLDELNESQVVEIAKSLKIPLLDHKHETLKKLIRDKWSKKKIIEAPVMGMVIAPKKKNVRKENYQFNRKFSPAELTTKSIALSQACIDRNTLEDEKKAIISQYKAKIEAENGRINLLAGELQRGSENVLKTCEVFYDFDKATKHYSYEGVEVGTERMEKKDYQLQAEFDEQN